MVATIAVFASQWKLNSVYSTTSCVYFTNFPSRCARLDIKQPAYDGLHSMRGL